MGSFAKRPLPFFWSRIHQLEFGIELYQGTRTKHIVWVLFIADWEFSPLWLLESLHLAIFQPAGGKVEMKISPWYRRQALQVQWEITWHTWDFAEIISLTKPMCNYENFFSKAATCAAQKKNIYVLLWLNTALLFRSAFECISPSYLL